MTPIRHAAIIAGGASRRMGRDKALIEVGGKPLITRVAEVMRPLFPEVIVVTANTEVAVAAQLTAIPDIYPKSGPLGGIHAALTHTQAPTFCVACDMPCLDAGSINYLCGQFNGEDAIMPRIDGRPEPLHAIYSPTALPRIESELQRERVRGFEALLREWEVRWVPEVELRAIDPDLRGFENWNTPGDVAAGRP